jgi:Cu-Zn family superoxide dismutase
MTINADGTGRHEVVLKELAIAPGPTSVVGRAIVLHEKPDDLRTQPSGNSGARIGCGVIIAK